MSHDSFLHPPLTFLLFALTHNLQTSHLLVLVPPAKINAGVSYEESIIAAQLQPSIYERIGKEDGFLKLSQLFYNAVFEDTDNQWFLNIFSSSTKQEAVENQYRFFVQTFGGPDLYR